MQVTTSEYKWRDRILLLFVWGTILFSATVNWAFDGLPVEMTADSFQNYWQSAGLYIYTILPLVILLFPLLIWLISRRIPSFSNALEKFQRPAVFWGLVFLFNLGLVSLIYQRFRNSHLIEFLLISLCAVIILWFFYRRTTFDIGKMIIAVTLWATIIVVRQTLPLLQDKVDFFAASWYTKIYILLMVIPLIGSILLPFVILFKPGRKLIIYTQRLFEAVPVGIPAVIFIISSFWTFGVFWTMENEYLGVLAMRLGIVAIILSGGGMLLWTFSGESDFLFKELPKIGQKWYTILLILFFVAYAVLAVRIGVNNLEVINPDGLSYLDIGREYAKGNMVVRGYWAPLLSWLISPLIALGLTPHASFQILNGLAGLGWILITLLLAKRARLNTTGRLALAVTMIVIALSNGFAQVTPDILGSMFIAIYFYWITNPSIEQKPLRYGVAIGLSGALAYLAKYYNLPFVLAHISLTAILYIHYRRRIRAVIISSVTSLCIVMICVSPWIIALYHRYGDFTITTSGPISRAIVGPGAIIHPCWSGELCDQPTDVLFPWEDPQFQYYPSIGWSPFESLKNFRYQILLMKDNVWNWTSSTLFVLGPFLPFAFLTNIVTFLKHRGDVKRRLFWSWILLTSLLYALGYMFTFSSAFRYYFPILPILFIAGYSSVQKILERTNQKVSKDKTVWLRAFIIILFVVIIHSLGKLDLIGYFLTNRNDPCLRDASLILKEYLEAPIAGTDIRSNYIAYYTETRTLGVLAPQETAAGVNMLLRKFGVQTFIVSSELDLERVLVSQYSYSSLFDMQICSDNYTVLKVPD